MHLMHKLLTSHIEMYPLEKASALGRLGGCVVS